MRIVPILLVDVELIKALSFKTHPPTTDRQTMTGIEHNKILAIGFGMFAAILGFTFLLLMLVSFGVFVTLGISFANETGNGNQAGIGILGGVFAVIFYVLLGAIFVIPTSLATWKMLKRRRNARNWGIIAAILVAPIMPLGTILGIYGLWFFFSAEGRRFYLSLDAETIQALANQ